MKKYQPAGSVFFRSVAGEKIFEQLLFNEGLVKSTVVKNYSFSASGLEGAAAAALRSISSISSFSKEQLQRKQQ